MNIWQAYQGAPVIYKGRKVYVEKFWKDMGKLYFNLRDASGLSYGTYIPQDELTPVN